MDLAETMKALEAAGSEQTRKTYTRHGVRGPQFGVSYAVLKPMAKKIKTDHALAGQLWDTGNHDARVLALMIADPRAATTKQIEQWAKSLGDYVLTGALAGFIAKTPHGLALTEKWQSSKDEWLGSVGWGILAHLAANDAEQADAFFEKTLQVIEKEIHTRKNRVRHEMNSVVIGIGVRNPRLTELAVAAAKRIGKVDVDHGDTSCETPDAAAYIRKTLERRKKKK
jgi:3-methyladenine DNA glycosylase AlkD